MQNHSDPQKTESSILIVDDTPANLEVLIECLGGAGYNVRVAKDGETAIQQSMYNFPDLILLDVLMPGIDGYETCKRLKSMESTKDIPIIFMTALSEIENKLHGFKLGSVDYITKPLKHEEVLARVSTHLTIRNLRLQLQNANEELEQKVKKRTAQLENALIEVRQLKNRLQDENNFLHEEVTNFTKADQSIIFNSKKMQKVIDQVLKVAETDATVLIIGETGTGKELVARRVHQQSKRAQKLLVTLNCAALPKELIESELFGHEKGAFTGAVQQKKGRFEIAHTGTLFLDEIGELSLEAQAKLLRVLQEQEIYRVGSEKAIKIDVRVIAATNRDLEDMTHKGTFREDLYYRLCVFPIHLPPLRDRNSDISILIGHYLKLYGRKLGKTLKSFKTTSLEQLISYRWPGNIRELQNVVERCAILATNEILDLDCNFSQKATNHFSTPAKPEHKNDLTTVTQPAKSQTMDELMEAHILLTLKECNGVIEGKSGAAAKLGIKPSTLRYRMKKLGLEKISNYTQNR